MLLLFSVFFLNTVFPSCDKKDVVNGQPDPSAEQIFEWLFETSHQCTINSSTVMKLEKYLEPLRKNDDLQRKDETLSRH